MADRFEEKHEKRPWREGLRREGIRVFVKDLPPAKGVQVLAEIQLRKKAIVYFPKRIAEQEKNLPEPLKPIVRGKLIDLAIVHELGHMFWNVLAEDDEMEFPVSLLEELENTNLAKQQKKYLASPVIHEIACHWFTRRILQLEFHPAVVVLYGAF